MIMRVDLDQIQWDEFALVIYNGEPFTGEVVEKSPDGAIVAVTNYTDGLEDGPSTEWYPSGQLRARGLSRLGTAVGVHQEWHPNGRLAAETRFDDQGRQLSGEAWDEAGNESSPPDYRR
jgi:antitoxin component YwqK of YwqJK toxin-antitoxin module